MQWSVEEGALGRRLRTYTCCTFWRWAPNQKLVLKDKYGDIQIKVLTPSIHRPLHATANVTTYPLVYTMGRRGRHRSLQTWSFILSPREWGRGKTNERYIQICSFILSPRQWGRGRQMKGTHKHGHLSSRLDNEEEGWQMKGTYKHGHLSSILDNEEERRQMKSTYKHGHLSSCLDNEENLRQMKGT